MKLLRLSHLESVLKINGRDSSWNHSRAWMSALYLAVIMCNFQQCREQKAFKNKKYSCAYKTMPLSISQDKIKHGGKCFKRTYFELWVISFHNFKENYLTKNSGETRISFYSNIVRFCKYQYIFIAYVDKMCSSPWTVFIHPLKQNNVILNVKWIFQQQLSLCHKAMSRGATLLVCAVPTISGTEAFDSSECLQDSSFWQIFFRRFM